MSVTQTERLDTAAVTRLRADFPILQQQNRGRQVCYLDSAATSQKPGVVIDALADFYRSYNANVHRGVYEIAERATEAYENARRRVATFLGAASPAEVVFVRNATEALNLVAYSWGRANLQRGDRIVSTVMEHHSNLVPWQLLRDERELQIDHIDVDGQGHLDMEALRQSVARGAKLVTLTAMSNVLGTVPPVREIADVAHAAGALVLVDGAQSAAHGPTDVGALGCDFFAFSGHKTMGPTGSGALWARRELLEAMPPFLSGGEMISQVTLEGARWNELPWKFEAGTADIAAAIGLGAAVDYLMAVGLQRVEEWERELTGYAYESLQDIPGLRIFGPPPDDRGGLISFDLAGVHPHDIASILDADGVCVRAGHHCAQPLTERLGVVATTRASFYLYNLPEEVDRLSASLRRVRKIFGLD